MSRCNACNRVFGSQQALDQHRLDAPAHTKSYKCNDCGRGFGSKKALEHHRRDSPSHAVTYHCGDCGRKFASQDSLDQHRHDSHVRLITFECDDCHRKFGSQDALDQHRHDSHVQPMTYDCIDCDRTFGSHGALDQHRLDSPAHAVTYDCNDCDRTFGSQQALDQHHHDSHARARSGNCDDCRSDADTSWCMRPDLHEDVSDLLAEENLTFTFRDADESERSIKDWDTNLMGRFVCPNNACSCHGWGSRKIAVSIRLFAGEEYNARVYRQRCKKCTHLGQHILDVDNYAERIAYRLKKWSGIEMEPPPFLGQSNAPHRRDLCEGCKNGHCDNPVVSFSI